MVTGVLAIVHFALHTYSRAYPGAPKPPWLGGGSGRTGQAAGVSWLADLLPSEPRARPSQPPAQPRGSSWVDGASSCMLPQNCCVLPPGSHREQLPPRLQTASCHAWWHGVQPVVRLRCGQEAHAGGGCSTCLVDGADWRGMASTTTIVPKDLGHWSPPCAPHLPTHQRSRLMDGASHVWGPSHRRAQQLQRWPMRFVSAHIWWPLTNGPRQPSLCSPWSVRGSPRSTIAHMNVLSPFRVNHSWNYVPVRFFCHLQLKPYP